MSEKILDAICDIYHQVAIDNENTMELQKRIDWYFEYCRELNIFPFFEGLCLSIGMDNKTFLEKCKDDSETGKILSHAKQLIITALESLGIKGKINAATYIFLMKQIAGYTDKGLIREIELPPNHAE